MNLAPSIRSPGSNFNLLPISRESTQSAEEHVLLVRLIPHFPARVSDDRCAQANLTVLTTSRV